MELLFRLCKAWASIGRMPTFMAALDERCLMQLLIDTNILGKLMTSVEPESRHRFNRVVKRAAGGRHPNPTFTLTPIGFLELLGFTLKKLGRPLLKQPIDCENPQWLDAALKCYIEYYSLHSDLSRRAIQNLIQDKQARLPQDIHIRNIFKGCFQRPLQKPAFMERIYGALGIHCLQTDILAAGDHVKDLFPLFLYCQRERFNYSFYPLAEAVLERNKTVALRRPNLPPDVRQRFRRAQLPKLHPIKELLDREIFQALCIGMWINGNKQKITVITEERQARFLNHIQCAWAVYSAVESIMRRHNNGKIFLKMRPGEIFFCNKQWKVNKHYDLRDLPSVSVPNPY